MLQYEFSRAFPGESWAGSQWMMMGCRPGICKQPIPTYLVVVVHAGQLLQDTFVFAQLRVQHLSLGDDFAEV